VSTRLVGLVAALAAWLVASPARATPDDDLVTAPAAARSREPADAELAVLRLRGLREWVDPARLLSATRALVRDPAVLPSARALATFVGAELARDLGQGPTARRDAASLGFITRWLVVGPFDNEGRAGLDRPAGPEEQRRARIDPDAEFPGQARAVRWRLLPDEVASLGRVPLDAMVRPSVNACAYAHTTVRVTAAGPAVLRLGASGAVRAWVDGREVLRDPSVRRAFPDRDAVPLTLTAGLHRLLLKVCTDERGMAFYARLTRPDGAALRLEASADPAAAPVLTAPAGAAPALPASVSTFARLRSLADRSTRAEDLERIARYLVLTGSDDANDAHAADFAERSAQAAPTPVRWMLAAGTTTDRGRRMEALRQAYALAPDDPRVLLAVGRDRRGGGYAEEALPYLEASLRADDLGLEAAVEHARVLEAIGLPLAAFEALSALAARAPRAPGVLRAAMHMAERAQQGASAQRLRRALSQVRAGDAEPWEALARDARQRGDRAAVTALADEIVGLDRGRLDAYSMAAELLESVGEGDRAVATLGRALEIAPDEPALWSAKGALEERLARVEAARESLQRALLLRPQDATIRRHLEALAPAQARPDEAEAEAAAEFLRRRGEVAAQETFNVATLTELTARTVYANGLSGTFRQIAYEVRSAQGARDGRAYTMQYDPDSQRFALRAARVHRRDGGVQEGTQVQEFASTSDPSARMYFSNRVVQVTFPDLRPGDVVELQWRVDDVSPRNAFADYFGDFQFIQASVPRDRWRYVLRSPTTREMFVHTAALPGNRAVTATSRVDDDATVRTWTAEDVPAVAPEDHAPGFAERAAYLHVSTYRDWAAVGRWYWGLVRDQLIADDRLRGVVRDITRGLTDDRAKVRAIYNWVIAHTRYVALEFGIHGFKPYLVPQICARGFGDCKDKASVIVTMLREAGIEASLVLLRTRHNGNIATEPASLAVFDHAIAYVPSLDLFLDGTAQHSGVDELPGGDQGVMALVVDGRGDARLVQTPVYTPERNRTVATAELTLRADGGAALSVTQELRGPNAAGARSQLEAQATRVERIEDDLRELLPGVRVTSVRAEGIEDVERPVRLIYEATVPTIGTRQGDTVLLYGASPVQLTRRFATRSTRSHDLVLGVPSMIEESRTIRLPPGASVLEVPPPVRLEGPFGRFEYAITAQGNTLAVRRVTVLSRDRVPPAEYGAFREFCQAVDDAVARRIVLRLPAAGRAEVAR
jgi:transglutaminase-like putative cysteine protease/tetratricopeptide (TPR) repeat protein